MPVINIANEQVIELIRQLPRTAKADAFRALLADVEWDELLAYGESRLDNELQKRGLSRESMTTEQIEQAINDIAESQ